MEKQNAIEVNHLTKGYPGFSLDIPQFVLPQGSIVGLVGENGAGKSTLIKLIMGMIHPENGSVILLGRDNRRDIHLLKEDIGVVLDQMGIPECLNSVQLGKIMATTFLHWDESCYEQLIKSWKIPTDKEFKDFSKGMKMQLQLAVALSHNARLLILDEATNGLDPVIRDEILDILEEFTRREEHSVLLSSHIVSDLEKISDYIAFLHQGRLLLFDEKDRLLDNYGLIQCNGQELEALPKESVWIKRTTAYGIEAVVDRRGLSGVENISPVSLEELFIAIVKEGEQ